MVGWFDGCDNGQMYGLMDSLIFIIKGQMYGLMDGLMDVIKGQMYSLIEGLMMFNGLDVWFDGWFDG